MPNYFKYTGVIIALLLTTVAQANPNTAELLQLVNKERREAGLSELTLSSPLNQAAQHHADDMSSNNYFSHTGLDSSQMSDRASAKGYRYRRIGENIAAGQSTATETMQGWIKSAGHRKNILNPHYKEVGFGYSYSSNSCYRHYWVQVFGVSQLND
ncbi:MAG: CAP domain-containing protein [Methylococcales bacterium]|nr:CAP domain-containing protein [Methylococcales bacterium]